MTHGNSGKQFCSRLARLFVVVALGVVVGSGEALAIPIPNPFAGLIGAPVAPEPPNTNTSPLAKGAGGTARGDNVAPDFTDGKNVNLKGGTVPGAAAQVPSRPDEAAVQEAGAKDVEKLIQGFTNLPLTDGFTAFYSADPGVASAWKASIDAAQGFSFYSSLNLPPNAFQSGKTVLVGETFSECVAKKQKTKNLTAVDARNECQGQPIEIGTDHQSANAENPNKLDSDGPYTRRFTSLAFLSNKEFAKRAGDDMPFEEESGSDSDSLKESFRLTSEAFCSIYGDVIITMKSDPKTNVINSQMQRIAPWTCRQRDPKADEKKFFNRDQLLELCKDPVSLEVHRYCRAMYYYDLIKWTMQAQCVAYNNAAIPGPRFHQPMNPRKEQDCKGGSLLTGDSECPGPWGVARADWDRTQEDLSLPGYTFTRGTAEAFFWAYGRETPTILGGGINIFQAITSIIRNPLGLLSQGTTLLCGDLSSTGRSTGRAEFTTVAKHWKGRHPVWVKAAMRFANARALLWTRDLTMQAWGVIQGFTSTIGMKELSEQAKQLLTNAYNKDDEATVQKQLEWTAEILKKLEVEADLARKSGAGVVGNAR